MILFKRKILGLSLLLLTVTNAFAQAECEKTETIDEDTGMIIDKQGHWEIVKATCIACHSAKQFLSQQCDRETWTEIIDWMQNEQGLWKLDQKTENQILDYLSCHYAPPSETEKRLAKQRKIDETSGLIIDEHWELIKANCSACHSAQKFLRQHMDRATWKETIKWMQNEHGLWQFDADTEKKILDYLTTNYGLSTDS